jgi:hypothetical protein
VKGKKKWEGGADGERGWGSLPKAGKGKGKGKIKGSGIHSGHALRGRAQRMCMA